MEEHLELPSIGWQLFALVGSQSDSTASFSSLDTYATRLLTEPLNRAHFRARRVVLTVLVEDCAVRPTRQHSLALLPSSKRRFLAFAAENEPGRSVERRFTDAVFVSASRNGDRRSSG